MVTLTEFVILTSFVWLILIAVANRVDLTKYNIFVSSGFLIYTPEIFQRLVRKLASYENFWKRLGKLTLFPTVISFLLVPLMLSVNLIQGIFQRVSPIFITDVISIFRIETFLLILPALAIFLSVQFICTSIFDIIDGKEVDKAGILLVGFVLSIFSTTEGTGSSRHRLYRFSSIFIITLLIVGISIPVGMGMDAAMDSSYGESEGAIITYILPNTPAADSLLENGDIIIQIIEFTSNLGERSTDITSAALFTQKLLSIPAQTEFVIVTNDTNQVSITGVVPPSDVQQNVGSYLGLEVEDYREPPISFLSPLLPLWISVFFDWMVNFGLLFSLYSLLPLPKTAGYALMEEIIEAFDLDIPPKSQQIISILSFLLLVANIIFHTT